MSPHIVPPSPKPFCSTPSSLRNAFGQHFRALEHDARVFFCGRAAQRPSFETASVADLSDLAHQSVTSYQIHSHPTKYDRGCSSTHQSPAQHPGYSPSANTMFAPERYTGFRNSIQYLRSVKQHPPPPTRVFSLSRASKAVTLGVKQMWKITPGR